jgi:hypothetical protein
MLNISTSQPVSWSTAPSPPAMAAVGAVPAVGAVQPSARDSQADSGRSGQGSPRGGASPVVRGTGEGKSNPVQAVPLLPREHAEESTTSPASMVDEARQRAEQQKDEDQKAREKAEQKLQLQEVLASVWKASAAVVDVVLGREPVEAVNAVDAELTSKVAPATSQPVQASLPGMQDGIADPVMQRREQEPVAYTVQGTGSWAPMEAGMLLSQRV